MQQFFNIDKVIDPTISAIAENIYRQELNKPFVEKFVKYAGYPVWDKAIVRSPRASNPTATKGTKGSSKAVAIIPLALEGDSTINSIMQVALSPGDTAFNMLYRWQYNQNGYQENDSLNNADKTALFFMGLERYVFGHNSFFIRDSLLLKGKRGSDTVQINSFSNLSETGKMVAYSVDFEICYQVTCVFEETARGTTSTLYCEHCETYSTLIWLDDGFPDDPPTGGTGGDPGGSGSSGDGGNGGWNDNPCNGDPLEITRLEQNPCNDPPAWVPNEPPAIDNTRDPNGYLYSRIAELQMILNDFPQALLPCDSLNIMPLEQYGAMWQNVAQFTPSQYVKDRIDSIRNALPGWIVDDYNIQSLTEASGAIVNCDYFPVRITQMPTGFTPESLLEYFRTHINSFIDSSLEMSFAPYYQGTIFNDSLKFLAPYDSSIGSLWHLDLGAQEGSVVESGYNHIVDSNYQSHYFTISTIETVTDFEHPVAGNRRWGLFSDSRHQGEFTFYTIGVDRIWDNWFVLGDFVNQYVLGNLSGFQRADQLWSSLQSKMALFIIDHGGHAEYYSPPSIIARPKWKDVADYLKGTIDFLALKQKLGC
ncbi:MAG TPA: hypothetical protein PLM81_06430 [Ginsengibacter sp.]|nr:hypothetical protein [Ginsengibacter sp.]HRP17089.1 hypothetical protein [Ginsengibacter sp.]HRP43593.1 hypothetical protein [Ginsengibacter sp.]